MTDRTVSVKLKAEVAAYVASMRTAGRATTDLEKASLKVAAAFSDEEDAAGRVRVAQLKLNELLESGKAKASQLAAAEEQLAAAERNLTQVRERSVMVGQEFVAEQERAAAAVEDTTEVVEEHGRATEKVAQRAQAQWHALVAVLVGGAPIAAATATGTAVALAAAGFVGFGAVALRNNAAVRQSFEDLSGEINAGLAQDAAVLQDEFVGAAGQISGAYQRLRPQLRAAFSASQPLVADLVGGVTDFAENAMPGMVRSVERAGPAVKGLRSLLGDLGSGLGGFFDELSEHSEEAGEGLEHLGALLKGVLTGTAPILGDLTDLWAEHGDEVADVVTRIIGLLGGLTNGALPGVSSGLDLVLDVADGVLDILEPMEDILGPLASSWLAVGLAMRLMRGVGGIIGRVTDSVTDLGDASGRAEGRVSRMGKAAGLAGLAIIGAGAALASSFSDPSVATNIDALTDGLGRWARQGEVSGEAARFLGEDLEGLSDALEQLGGWANFAAGPVQDVVEFLSGGAYEGGITQAENKIRDLGDALAGLVEDGKADVAAKVFELVAAKANEMGVSTEELTELMPQYTAAMGDAASKTQDLGLSTYQSIPGVDSLKESLKVLSDQTADTSDKVDALNSAWRQLFGTSLTMEEATAAFEEGLDQMASSIEELRKETSGWRGQLLTAKGAVNLTTEAGRSLSEQLIQQGESYRALAQTAYDSARQQGQSQQQALQAAISASSERRAQFISEARQMGFTADQARVLANRYLGLPDDVRTLIEQPGMATARAAAKGYASELNGIPPFIGTTVHTRYTVSGGRLATGFRDGGLVKGYADGGRVQGFPGGGMVRGPGGPREDKVPAMLSNREFVVNAAATAKNLPLLHAINAGRDVVRAMADGGAVMGVPGFGGFGGGSVTNVYVTAPNYVGSAKELVTAIRGEVRKSGGGDVQAFLGRRSE
jgi:hypothetical protein